MLFQEKEVIRTNVENLFLEEMVTEDQEFLLLNDENEFALDDLSSLKTGLFDDIPQEDSVSDILNDIEDDWLTE